MTMRVLLAVDNSEASREAAEQLKELRFCRQVALEVVSVLPPLPIGDTDVVGVPGSYGILAEELESAEKAVSGIAAQFGEHFHAVVATVKLGEAGSEIVELASASHTNLIVLGAIGHSALQRVLLGSVAEYVSQHAKSSILVVRPRATNYRKRSPCRVLVALENTPHDRKVLSNLHALQFDSAAEIHLVHVMPVLNFFRQDLRKRSPELWIQAYDSAVEHAKSLEEMVAHAGYETHARAVESEHVGKALIKYAEDNHCDLIVTGDRGHNSIERLLLGSTSRFILRHSPSSMLVVKEPVAS